MNKLQVLYNGVPMSIQQAYTVLLGSYSGCTLNEYRTYAHLVKQGYILLRHSKNQSVTRYEQKIRLHQYTLGQKQFKTKPKTITDASVNEKHNRNEKYEVKSAKAVDDVPVKVQKYVNTEQNLKEAKISKIGDKECPNASTSEGKRHVHASTTNENTFGRLQNKECHSQLTSQNDHEDLEVEESGYPSTSSLCSEGTNNIVALKEQDAYNNKNSQNVIEIVSLKEKKNDTIKKEKEGLPSKSTNGDIKAKPLVPVSSSSDIIILDDDIEPSSSNKSKQLNETSTSDLESIKSEPSHFKTSSKRKFNDVEMQASVDRKPLPSDLDDECEVLEITASTKRQKHSPQRLPGNILQRLMDTTTETKTETKYNLANFHSNSMDWIQPSSSKVGISPEATNSGKHRITNVQLSDTEIEIVPGIIDKIQEKKQIKHQSENDIQVIDLEDDDGEVKPSPSKKEERIRILDSLPSVEGKFLIHVKAPPQNLLPPNVTPQKKDYYIQLWRLNAAGIGGRPRVAENGQENNDRGREHQSLPESRINPWLARPQEQNRANRPAENNMWGANVNSGATFFNQSFVTPQFNVFQAMWQQFTTFFPFMNNPMWNVNSFGMQLPWMQPQLNMWRPPWQNRGRPWRRPYGRRARGRFRPESRRFPVNEYVSSSDAETDTRNANNNRNNGTAPLKMESNEVVERNYNAGSKLDVTKIKSSNLNNNEDTKELIILDDDDDEPVAISPTGAMFQSKRQNQRRNKQKKKKKSAGRYFEPPKKLIGLMERLVSETKAAQMLKEEDGNVDDDDDDDNNDDENYEDAEKNPENVMADNIGTERKQMKLGEVKNWKDLKTTVSHVMQEIILDSASSGDETEEEIDVMSNTELDENQISSLLQPEDCINMDTVLSRLQIISSLNVQEDEFSASEKIHKISFDVYLPNTPFRKASPGLPKYRIAVLGFQDHIPSLGELAKMMRQFQDDVPLVFAIVIPDSVTFFQLGSVNVPVEITFPDLI